MSRARGARWLVVLLALASPFLSTCGCTSNPPQFMGRDQPDAWHPTPGDSLRTAGSQVGVVVGATVLVAGGALALLWLWSHDDDEDPHRTGSDRGD